MLFNVHCSIHPDIGVHIGSVCPSLKSPNRDKLVIVPERPVASFPVLSLRQHLRSLATMAPIASSPMETVDQLVAANRVMVFSKTTCPFCTKIKNLFEQLQVKIEVLELDQTGECQHNVYFREMVILCTSVPLLSCHRLLAWLIISCRRCALWSWNVSMPNKIDQSLIVSN